MPISIKDLLVRDEETLYQAVNYLLISTGILERENLILYLNMLKL